MFLANHRLSRCNYSPAETTDALTQPQRAFSQASPLLSEFLNYAIGI